MIVPTFNAAAWLGEALASVCRQTLRDLEVLVVDDASTDGTPGLLADWAARDRRVRPLRLARRSGPSAARNLALEHARGRWIAPLDADDAFDPIRLERLVGAAERLGADMVADDLLRASLPLTAPLERHLGRDAVLRAPGPLTLEAYVALDAATSADGRSRAVGYLKPIIRRDFIARHRLRYDEDVAGAEDFLLYGRCVGAGARFFLQDEALYVYRLRDSSLSHSPGLAARQAAANRRLAGLAGRSGHIAARTMLRRRQRQFERAALFDLAGDGRWISALAVARWGDLRLLGGDLRTLVGAARRAIVGRASARQSG